MTTIGPLMWRYRASLRTEEIDPIVATPQTVQLCWCSSDSSQCALFIECLIEEETNSSFASSPLLFHQSGTRCCLVSNLSVFFPYCSPFFLLLLSSHSPKNEKSPYSHCYVVRLYFALRRFQSMLTHPKLAVISLVPYFILFGGWQLEVGGLDGWAEERGSSGYEIWERISRDGFTKVLLWWREFQFILWNCQLRFSVDMCWLYSSVCNFNNTWCVSLDCFVFRWCCSCFICHPLITTNL